MAGKIQINRITNANIYLDGNNLLGRASEIKLPAGFDKLEGEIKWNSFYHDVMRKTANPWQAVALQCRSSIDCYNSQGKADQLALVTHMTVMFKKNPLGTFKQNENPEFSSAFGCTYIKQVVDGETLLELDYLANIFRVNGADQLNAYRNNIGG